MLLGDLFVSCTTAFHSIVPLNHSQEDFIVLYLVFCLLVFFPLAFWFACSYVNQIYAQCSTCEKTGTSGRNSVCVRTHTNSSMQMF